MLTKHDTNILKILIIEDESEVCDKYTKLFDAIQDICIVGTTNNSEEGYQLTCAKQPHVVILDLELHLGQGSGIDYLENFQKTKLSFNPYIIVSTNNSSATTYEYIRRLGVDYIFYKYQEGFSENSVAQRIIQMKSFLLDMRNSAPHKSEDSSIDLTNIKKQYISNQLQQLNITPKLKGYYYLLDAILMVSDSSEAKYSSLIANKAGKSKASVERAMQNAILHAWTSCSIDVLSELYTAHFDANKNNPTLAEFVFFFANKTNTTCNF